MKKLTPLVAAASFCASLALATSPSFANAIGFTFTGPGVSGNGTFTIEPNVSPPDPNPDCGTVGNDACRSDPPGAYRITNITGTFSDTAASIINASITGLVPINPANERDAVFDPLVPTSLSYIDNGDGSFLTYNNLFYPNGSPIVCDFPFVGTFVDVFGTAFTVDGGYTVNLWGDGNSGPNGALTYGVAVSNGANILDYQFDGVSATAPEPASIWLLFGGLLMFGASLKGASASRARR